MSVCRDVSICLPDSFPGAKAVYSLKGSLEGRASSEWMNIPHTYRYLVSHQ